MSLSIGAALLPCRSSLLLYRVSTGETVGEVKPLAITLKGVSCRSIREPSHHTTCLGPLPTLLFISTSLPAESTCHSSPSLVPVPVPRVLRRGRASSRSRLISLIGESAGGPSGREQASLVLVDKVELGGLGRVG